MSYTPKHAKPASAKDVALSAYHGAFWSAASAPGRHARHGRQGNGEAQRLAVPEQARAVVPEQARDSATPKAGQLI